MALTTTLKVSAGLLAHVERDRPEGRGDLELVPWGLWRTLDLPVHTSTRFAVHAGVGGRVQRLVVRADASQAGEETSTLARWQAQPIAHVEVGWRVLPPLVFALRAEAGWLPQRLILQDTGQPVRERGGWQAMISPSVGVSF